MKIGITGGIGSGKSYICHLLQDIGYPVYNCDEEAKRLMTSHPGIIAAIRKAVGDDAYSECQAADGSLQYALNRPRLAAYLFANAENASTINAIVHPIVKDDFLHWAERQGTEHVIMECAILFESHFDDVVDKAILIYADEHLRLQRAMKRDKATEQQIRGRMRHQIQGEEARRRADYIFEHNDYSTTQAELQKCIAWIKGASLKPPSIN